VREWVSGSRTEGVRHGYFGASSGGLVVWTYEVELIVDDEGRKWCLDRASVKTMSETSEQRSVGVGRQFCAMLDSRWAWQSRRMWYCPGEVAVNDAQGFCDLRWWLVVGGDGLADELLSIIVVGDDDDDKMRGY
jgi:hypothetical protein